MDTTALAWQFQISNESSDLTHDVIKLAGWRLQNFAKNGPVFFCHDSSTLPVGQSSLPWTSGSALMANVTFPAAGISAVSDQVRGMIAAGVLAVPALVSCPDVSNSRAIRSGQWESIFGRPYANRVELLRRASKSVMPRCRAGIRHQVGI